MAKNSKSKRIQVGLVSKLTGHRTYVVKKNKQNTPGKLKLKKYDPIARKHAEYEETTKNLGRNVVKPKKR